MTVLDPSILQVQYIQVPVFIPWVPVFSIVWINSVTILILSNRKFVTELKMEDKRF